MMARVRILFDSVSCVPGLRTGWGLSLLIGDTLLFDTGGDGQALVENFSALGLDPASVRTVVISHDHADHTGGLWHLLQRHPGRTVVGCPSFSDGFRRRVEASGSRFAASSPFCEVADGILTTGEMDGEYGGRRLPEQALIVKGAEGLSLLTGCCHFGIPALLRRVREGVPAGPASSRIRLVAGGFHLGEASDETVARSITALQEEAVEAVIPLHCSGETACELFAQRFGSHPSAAGAGSSFEA